jgi:ferredoxin-type protein NapF
MPSTRRERPSRDRLWQAGRGLILVAAVVLAWPFRTESSTSVVLPALSPFIAVASAISVRAVSVLALLSLPVLLLVMIYPRWFCRHGCPVGLLQEILENRMLRWRRPAGREQPPLAANPVAADVSPLHLHPREPESIRADSRRLLRFRSLKRKSERGSLTPTPSPNGGEGDQKRVEGERRAKSLRQNVPRRRRQRLSIGPWLVLLTFGGALLGYPLFLWLDPLAIFNGFLNAWRQPIALATLLTGLGLPLLLLLDVIAPRLWCQHICPLGATQDVLVWPRRLGRRNSRCEVLPAADEERRVSGNQGPLTPALSPDGGEGDRRPGSGKNASTSSRHRRMDGVALGRRWFLGACVGAAGAFAMKSVRGKIAPPLRPPGSLDEPRFTGVCVRCGNCAQVCPSKIVQPDFGASGVAGFLTPRLRFDEDYCREDCHRCNEVCPSGAIARLSLADKRRNVIGRAVVNLDLCLLAQGRECTACIQKCPYEAIAMHSADGGFSNEPRVVLDRCNGCGACEAVCPTQPGRAIRVQVLTVS